MTNELPPVLQLLKNELFNGENVDSFINSVRDLIPELRRQAEWSIENHNYTDGKSKFNDQAFAISPASGINPFSQMGKCPDLACRVKIAENFSRTFGLYSDVIYLPDPLTTWFIHDDGEVEWNDQEIMDLLIEVTILKILSPLIEGNIIKFISPVKAVCSSCHERLTEQIDDFSDEFISEFWNQITIEKRKDYLAVDTGILHDPGMVYRSYYDPVLKNRKNSKKLARELFFGVVSEEVHSHILTMYDASSLNSTIFSNSRAGLLSLKKLEGHNQNLSTLLNWEKSRTTELPWIKNLNPQQIVELRESASKSLPQFRELMHRNITLSSHEGLIDNDSKCEELIYELRSQAEEVKSELSAININNEKQFHNVGGMLGLSIALYSSAVANPLIGLSTLIATLALIHTNLKKDHTEVEKLTAKPGYVLVKAQEIINTHD